MTILITLIKIKIKSAQNEMSVDENGSPGQIRNIAKIEENKDQKGSLVQQDEDLSKAKRVTLDSSVKNEIPNKNQNQSKNQSKNPGSESSGKQGSSSLDSLNEKNNSNSQVQNVRKSSHENGIRDERVRFFIMKSLTKDNICTSIKMGIWGTSKANSDKLHQMYQKARKVVLIFSINESHSFQGYAVMKSDIDKASSVPSWGPRFKNFDVEWLKVCQLPFGETDDIRNPLNEDYPIKKSRDGQELAYKPAMKLMDKFDQAGDISLEDLENSSFTAGSKRPHDDDNEPRKHRRSDSSSHSGSSSHRWKS